MKRNWSAILFLAASIIILTVALGIAHVADVMQGRQDDLIRELKSTARQLDAEREKLQEASDRLAELEAKLLNLHQMQNICSHTGSALSRGGRQLTLTTMPATQPSGFTAARFERALSGTGLEGIGEALVQAETETGINALVLAGIIVHETGWGTSKLAREKHNLAGLGAYPGEEYSAGIRFDSPADSIMFLARLLRDRPGSLTEVGGWYATDPGWAAKVAGCMRSITQKSEVTS